MRLAISFPRISKLHFLVNIGYSMGTQSFFCNFVVTLRWLIIRIKEIPVTINSAFRMNNQTICRNQYKLNATKFLNPNFCNFHNIRTFVDFDGKPNRNWFEITWNNGWLIFKLFHLTALIFSAICRACKICMKTNVVYRS